MVIHGDLILFTIISLFYTLRSAAKNERSAGMGNGEWGMGSTMIISKCVWTRIGAEKRRKYERMAWMKKRRSKSRRRKKSCHSVNSKWWLPLTAYAYRTSWMHSAHCTMCACFLCSELFLMPFMRPERWTIQWPVSFDMEMNPTAAAATEKKLSKCI